MVAEVRGRGGIFYRRFEIRSTHNSQTLRVTQIAGSAKQASAGFYRLLRTARRPTSNRQPARRKCARIGIECAKIGARRSRAKIVSRNRSRVGCRATETDRLKGIGGRLRRDWRPLWHVGFRTPGGIRVAKCGGAADNRKESSEPLWISIRRDTFREMTDCRGHDDSDSS